MAILFGMRWHQMFTLCSQTHPPVINDYNTQTFRSCLPSSCWGRGSKLIRNYGLYSKKTNNYTEGLVTHHCWSPLTNTLLLQFHPLFFINDLLCFGFVMKYIGFENHPSCERFKCTPWPWRWSIRKLKLSSRRCKNLGNIMGICREYRNIIYINMERTSRYIYIYTNRFRFRFRYRYR